MLFKKTVLIKYPCDDKLWKARENVARVLYDISADTLQRACDRNGGRIFGIPESVTRVVWTIDWLAEDFRYGSINYPD